MAQGSLGQQLVRRHQFADHRAVGVAVFSIRRQNALAGKQRHVRRIGAVFPDHVEGVGVLDRVRLVERHQQLEIVFAMAGRGVNETGAGVGGDVRAGKKRHGKIVAPATEGMGANHVLGNERTEALDDDLGMIGRRFGQHIGQHDFLADLAEGALFRRHDLVDRVIHVRRKGDGAVAGNGPRRGGPDHHKGIAAHHRKLHIDGRRLFLVILDLGLGQHGFFHRRPHHRTEAAIEQPGIDELVQLAGNGRFGGEIHRQVGMAPFAHHPQALELGLLHLDPFGGEGAAFPTQLDHRHAVLGFAGLAVLFLDLPFDRQTVAVPARHVGRVIAHHGARTDDEVLENLVQAGAGMNLAVGIGRAVVKNEQLAALGSLADADIQPFLLPLLQPFRLGGGKPGLHGKIGLGQEQSGAVVFRALVFLLGHDEYLGKRWRCGRDETPAFAKDVLSRSRAVNSLVNRERPHRTPLIRASFYQRWGLRSSAALATSLSSVICATSAETLWNFSSGRRNDTNATAM